MSDEAVDRLAAQLKGEVFTPGDAEYDSELAGFNQIARHEPTLIVAAVCTKDVEAAVAFAAEQNLPVGVQATGHGIASSARAGVLVSTRRMNAVGVDPVSRIARVEAGAQWHQVINTAAYHNLAPLNGSSPLVGVVGYTLGGGLGPLGRQYGYAADHVTRIEIVTADGKARWATADQDSDLFWALRGGKGGFGIVTVLEFELMPVARFYGGGIHFPGELAGELLRTWQHWSQSAPEEMTSSVALLRMPDLPVIPEMLRGRLTAHLRIAFTGSQEEGERLLRPLRSVGAAVADDVRERPYATVAEIHQDPTDPLPYHERNIVLRDLDQDAVENLLVLAGLRSSCSDLMVEVRQLGGALSRPARIPNAVGSRGGAYVLSTMSVPSSPDHVLGRMAAWGTGGRYINFLAGPDTDDAAPDCFDRPTGERLARIKAAYDPRNLFRVGHTVEPGA